MYDVVGLVVIDHEPVVQQKPRIALPSVRVEYLHPLLDVLRGFDDEPLLGVGVVPHRLLVRVVVEHVGERHKRVSLLLADVDPEDSAADHHPGPAEVVEGDLDPDVAVHQLFVVRLNLILPGVDGLEQRRALQFPHLLLRIKYREVGAIERQNIDVGFKSRPLIQPLLQEVHGQVGVLRRAQL